MNPFPGGRTGLSRALDRLIPKSRLGRGVALLSGGTVAAQALVIFASPLLTRLYTPEDFGVLGVFSALLGLLALAVCLRYEIAVPLAEDEVTMVNSVALAVLAAVFSVTLFSLFLWAGGEHLVRWLNATALEPWLWLLPPVLLVVGCFAAVNHWAIRRQAFGRISRTRLTRAASQVVVQIGLGLVGMGALGLLIGQAIGQCAGVGRYTLAFVRSERHLLPEIRPYRMLAVAKRFRRLATYGALGALLSGSSRLLPMLLIAATYGTGTAGLLVLTERVLAVPMRLLGNAVAQVYLSEAPRLARENRQAMVVLFMRTSRRLFVIALVILIVVVLSGPFVFGLAFGAQWVESGMFARILAPLYLARLVVSPTSQTLTVLGREDLMLAWETGRLAVVVLVFVGAAQLDWPPVFAIIGLSATVATAYLILFLLTHRLLRGSVMAAT